VSGVLRRARAADYAPKLPSDFDLVMDVCVDLAGFHAIQRRQAWSIDHRNTAQLTKAAFWDGARTGWVKRIRVAGCTDVVSATRGACWRLMGSRMNGLILLQRVCLAGIFVLKIRG
jgi:hypothetical protein